VRQYARHSHDDGTPLPWLDRVGAGTLAFNLRQPACSIYKFDLDHVVVTLFATTVSLAMTTAFSFSPLVMVRTGAKTYSCTLRQPACIVPYYYAFSKREALKIAEVVLKT
jgi:hypothetical protein